MPGEPTYQHIAARIRHDITTGRLAPGQTLPSETMLQQTYGVARQTARRAVDLLRAEGLADFERGHGIVVRIQPERADLALPAGATLIARMPTPEERDEHNVREGVPLFVVTLPDETVQVYPADRWQMRQAG
jgi:DNA-binding FadR family transcriptional regulator